MGYEGHDADTGNRPEEYDKPERDNFISRMNYFSDDSTCNDWVSEIADRVRYKLFGEQQNFLWLSGELGRDENGSRKPCFYPDADEAIAEKVYDEMSDLVAGITYQLVLDYAWYGDIDVPDSLIEELDRHGYDISGLREAHGIDDDDLPEVKRVEGFNTVYDNGRYLKDGTFDVTNVIKTDSNGTETSDAEDKGKDTGENKNK